MNYFRRDGLGRPFCFLLLSGLMWASTPTECAFIELCRRTLTTTDCALIITLCSVDFCTHRRVRCPHRTLKFTDLRNLLYPLRRQGRHRLAAARSRSGSERPPDVHSLPSRRFATLQQGEAWIISADWKSQEMCSREIPAFGEESNRPSPQKKALFGFYRF